MDLAQVVAVGLVLASHAVALRRPWRDLRRRHLPRVVDFATLGVVLFYDVGLVLELAGVPGEARYVDPFLAHGTRTLILGTVTLAAAPWLLRGGARLTRRRTAPPPTPDDGRPMPLPWSFLALAVPVGVGLAVYGWTTATQAGDIWVARRAVGEAWGPLIVVLYLPLHLLAFVVARGSARGARGLLVAVGLALTAMLATLPVGQRTTWLLPWLLLGLFRTPHVHAGRLVAVGGALVLAAAALLPVFKWQAATTAAPLDERVLGTVHSDLSRAPLLAAAVERAEGVGTSVLPYPLAGYVYGALFFVPRAWAPWKGESTAKVFTADVVWTPVERTTWGFGVGLIEELILNAGWLALAPGLLVWGVGLGWLDRATRGRPALALPARLGALWLPGYGLVPVLLTFGVMGAVGGTCAWRWPARPRRRLRRSPLHQPHAAPLGHR